MIMRSLGLALVIILASTQSLAAKPTSIRHVEDIITKNDLIFSHYQVKCSDGRQEDISAWDNGKKWCTGKGGQNDCSKTQINAAKKACK